MIKQVYTFEKDIDPSDKIPQRVVFSLSKYADTLVIFANQTGAIGSIVKQKNTQLEGNVVESAGLTVEEDEEDWSAEEKAPLYELKILFGSSEIQFYEVLLRRLMSLIWQQKKTPQKFRVLFNVSLPVLSQKFDQQAYYSKIVQTAREGFASVL